MPLTDEHRNLLEEYAPWASERLDVLETHPLVHPDTEVIFLEGHVAALTAALAVALKALHFAAYAKYWQHEDVPDDSRDALRKIKEMGP